MTEPTATVVITCGDFIGSQPMGAGRFEQLTEQLASRLAVHYGTGVGVGRYTHADGTQVTEQTAMVAGATTESRQELATWLSVVAAQYGQESLGLIYQGDTDTLVFGEGGGEQ